MGRLNNISDIDEGSVTIIGFFVIVMLILSLLSVFTKQRHTQTIFTLGILGTFIGITWGLLEFDTNNIENSIPQLLSGLKASFVTSIAGMILVVLIEIIKGKSTKSHKSGLDGVYDVLDKIHFFQVKSIGQIIENQKKNNKTFENLDDFSDLLFRSLKAIENVIQDGNVKTKNGFDGVDVQLKKISKDISEGASEAIVNALQSSMDDFNKNLNKHFGENFKQLNESCAKMIKWQEEYKNQIDDGMRHLKENIRILESLSGSSERALRNSEESIRVGQRVEELILGCNGHIESMKVLLEGYRKISNEAHGTVKQVGDDLRNLNGSLDSTRENVQGLFKNQSEAIQSMSEGARRVANEVGHSLGESLNRLNAELTRLTEQFVEAYGEFIPRQK